MITPQEAVRSIVSESTRTLTFITTYKCTAACADCCFECSPDLESGKLSFEFMKGVIDEAMGELPSLQVVVFTGGECYMLKEHLFRTIAYATSRGLTTRTVTNGYWGKTVATARRTAEAVAAAGLAEVNISTGLDHQQWVPLASVINAARELTSRGIPTIITIEKDTEESSCLAVAQSHPTVLEMLSEKPPKLSVMCNSWMPFKSDSKPRSRDVAPREDAGCKQLFTNIVITPHKVVSACCGLTFEHIPEMRIGTYGAAPLSHYLDEIASDFLKIWIHVDGPKAIARKLLGPDDLARIENSVHICEACAVLHQDAKLREQLQLRYQEFLPDVMQRYFMTSLISGVAKGKAEDEKQELSMAG